MHQPGDGLSSFFTADHRHCDDLWGAFEAACGVSPAEAQRAFTTFDQVTRRHLQMEEDVVFPEFERRTGMTTGPTVVMRGEHDRIRSLLDQIAQLVESGDFEDALDQGDTLLLLTQQHNQKEEAVLYPMAEKVIGADWREVASRLK